MRHLTPSSEKTRRTIKKKRKNYEKIADLILFDFGSALQTEEQ